MEEKILFGETLFVISFVPARGYQLPVQPAQTEQLKHKSKV